jgi:hypothetical protein
MSPETQMDEFALVKVEEKQQRKVFLWAVSGEDSCHLCQIKHKFFNQSSKSN